MKKFINCFALALIVSVSFGLMSCDKNKKKPEPVNTPTAVAPLVVENTISTDRQQMFMMAGSEAMVKWFETTVTLTDYLNSENCSGEIEKIVNTFQKIVEVDRGYDTMVYYFTHTKDGESRIDSIHSWFAEDMPLNDEPLKLTFKKAFERVMEANIVKPASRYCVLRKEVGIKVCNAQYIFGNSRAQAYVDAVTGNVSAKNPVFDVEGFTMPLGEWP